jgi:hypothetical protein
MSGQNRDELSDKDKIDRAARHEEVRFLKKQRWAVATAGVILLGALLATIRNMHLTVLDKFLAWCLLPLGFTLAGCSSTIFNIASLMFDAGWTPPTTTQQLVAARFCTYTSSFW